jgi:RNA polymerase sigma-70 factor, ECF subfamily
MSDRRRARTVNDDPLRGLITTHSVFLRHFVLGLATGDHQLAENVVQDTFLRAWLHWESFPAADEERRRWLLTVARRLTIDDVRRRRARPVHLTPWLDENRVADDDPAATAVAQQTLREAVGSLSPAHRDVVDQIFFQHRSVEETARRLDVPEGTVRSRVHYALRAIRQAVTG